MLFNHIKVGQKLAVAFGGALAAVLLICTGVLVEQRVSIEVAARNAAAGRITADAERALGGLHAQNASVRGLALYRHPRFAEHYEALVTAADGHVRRGVQLVGRTGDVLARMLTQIAEVEVVVGDIAASSQEQAAALREVSTAVGHIDQVTQQNAAMVEQTTAASHNLADETEELARLIDRFALDRDPPAPAEVAPRSILKATGTDGGGGSAARESWDEF